MSILSPYNGMYTLHTAWANVHRPPSRGGYWCEGDTFARERAPQHREILLFLRRSRGWQELGPPAVDKQVSLLILAPHSTIQYR